MRCEGADNPPCRRCRHAGLECLFEKPSREASLTGEAGLECVHTMYKSFPINLPKTVFRRIRSLEAHVAEIRNSQVAIQHTLTEIVGHLRGTTVPRSPSVISQPYMHASPSMQAGSPAINSTVDTRRMSSSIDRGCRRRRRHFHILSSSFKTAGRPEP